MRNVDRWFILIGLLYGLFGFAFGIWVGINEHFEQAHLHAHINLIGFASMVLFGLLYRAYPALAESKLATVHFVIYTLGAIIFLAGIPLAQTHQTIVLAVVGSLSVLRVPDELLPECIQRKVKWPRPTSVRDRARWRQRRCGPPRPDRAAERAQ
jgi:predicted membrane channel-forming protein YqfA (hemolysin III family)